MSDAFDPENLIAEYRTEAAQQIEYLDRCLIGIEETGGLGAEEQAELLRVLHTLKGNSAMMGFAPIADRVHSLENVIKNGAENIPDLDPLFELSAAIRSAVERVGGPEQESALARLGASFELGSAAGSDSGRSPPGHPEADGPAATTAASPAGQQRREAAAPPDSAFPASEDLVRVPFAKLDEMLVEVGEVGTVQARLRALLGEHKRTLGRLGLLRELDEIADDLNAQTRALRDSTMALRLVPVRTVFGRFPALVRDLARAQGKRARLVLEGGEVELDKSVIDALGEPLMHLIRNAVDHGLEAPAERERAGKDPVGTIWLRAQRAGDRIELEVADDGAGLDRAEILRRARESGLLSGAGDEEPKELIFRPGFSTRDEATAVSGRGVGLDVVRRSTARLRGSLDVRAREPHGTAFVLRLPLTLAVVAALIFESEGEVMAIPASDVGETLPRRWPERLGGTEVVRDGDAILPLARPHRVFGWSDDRPEGSAGPAPYAILVRRGARSAAIPADRLLDQRSVVVKALPPYVGATPGVSGVTVAPDGRVILLLDSDALLDMNLQERRRTGATQTP